MHLLAESINDAIIECVKSCGGSKVVGVALWPAKGVEAAQRNLLACLNPDRNEKLSPDELMHVFRMARDKGCHVGINYMAHHLSYSLPTPIEPKDEAAELIRQYMELRKAAAALESKIDKAIPSLRVAA